MSQFIKEFGVINLELQTQIVNLVKHHLKANANPELEQSQLYSGQTETKFVDLEKRNSKYKAIVNEDVFDSCDRLIKIINEKDSFYDFQLVRNDVTYIKYEQGNFFKTHEDYLSYTSNEIEEFTLIMCIDANCIGGSTLFHINDYFTYKSSESVTPFHCLVFRKDLKHEGEILESGTKEILTLNLLGLSKNCDVFVVVTFPNEPSQKSYYISFDKIKSCGTNVFQTFISFNASKKEHILFYKETNYTYKEFEIVYRVLNKSYISIDEFKTHKDMLEYYCISVSNVLLTELQSTTKSIQNSLSFDSNIIINETQEQTAFMLELVKLDGLPFIPFKLVLVEGTKVYGGEMTGEPPDILKMTPVWFSVTDYNNVLFYKCLTSKQGNGDTLKQIIQKKVDLDFTKFFKSKCSEVELISFDDEDEEDVDRHKESSFKLVVEEDVMYGQNMFKLDLKVCKPDLSNSKITEMISERDSSGLVGKSFYSPRFNTIVSTSKHFSIDEHGKMVLSNEQQERVIKRIEELDLEEAVKSQMNTICFNLPQKKTILDEHFCNESVYGNMTVMFITGFIKMT